MQHKWVWLLAGWLIVVGLASCGHGGASLSADATSTPRSDTTPSRRVTSTPVVELTGTPAPLWTAVPMSPVPTPSNPVLQRLVMQAKEDLAGRLSIGVDQIGLVEAEAVEWPDASLGCPKPGMMYAQVVTPGYRIVLEAAGQSYEYHSDTRQRVVCCEPRQAWPVPGGASTETVELAKRDLAQRLGLSADSIDVVAVIRQEFSPDAFYCRKTKERISRDEPPATVSGESILLSAAGRTYEYHASDHTVVFCRPLP